MRVDSVRPARAFGRRRTVNDAGRPPYSQRTFSENPEWSCCMAALGGRHPINRASGPPNHEFRNQIHTQ